MKTKRFLTVLTSFVLSAVCILPSASYAESVAPTEDNSISAVELESVYHEVGFMDCVDVLLNNSDYMNISGDLSSAYIGNPFFINDIDADYIITEDRSTAYYPIIAADDVCAFIVATKNNGYISFSCGKFFADVFDEAGTSGDFSLICDGNENLYVIDDEQNISALIEYYDILEIASDKLEYVSLAVTSIDDAKTRLKRVSDINVASPYSVNIIMDYQLSGYPSYVQTGPNCWAYATLSMANYKLGTSLIEQVYGAFYTGNGYSYDNNGAGLTEIYNTIKSLFKGYSPVKYSGTVLSSSIIASTITNDLPSLIVGESSSKTRHAVALMGYRMDSTYLIPGNVSGIYTMNPQNGGINFNSYNPNGCSFSGVSKTYAWDGSVTLQ